MKRQTEDNIREKNNYFLTMIIIQRCKMKLEKSDLTLLIIAQTSNFRVTIVTP